MARGRKRVPTKIKELRGTVQPCRAIENEMQVSVKLNLKKILIFF